MRNQANWLFRRGCIGELEHRKDGRQFDCRVYSDPVTVARPGVELGIVEGFEGWDILEEIAWV